MPRYKKLYFSQDWYCEDCDAGQISQGAPHALAHQRKTGHSVHVRQVFEYEY